MLIHFFFLSLSLSLPLSPHLVYFVFAATEIAAFGREEKRRQHFVVMQFPSSSSPNRSRMLHSFVLTHFAHLFFSLSLFRPDLLLNQLRLVFIHLGLRPGHFRLQLRRVDICVSAWICEFNAVELSSGNQSTSRLTAHRNRLYSD